ncbi:hypothetical protein [Methanobrevibacter arboriphilus]|uniref:Uncharacterized protein n=1 Tax=Methanobrevibacter arboriphilus TaxID=39441 RepID=A0ACA8R2K6_METAZ|nr:hypothetical protein [Methanobrevibacter arboriphilus]BBL61533.1 hypothetical protein MarbSA_05730 [Methanobrevibacter arboriphilus]
MDTIKFDKYYSKLKNKSFTTIRAHYKNIKLGSVVECRVAGKQEKEEDIIFYARLRKIKVQTLWLIDDEILEKDLKLHKSDCYGISIDDALRVLREFYPDLQPEDNVFIYYFERN